LRNLSREIAPSPSRCQATGRVARPSVSDEALVGELLALRSTSTRSWIADADPRRGGRHVVDPDRWRDPVHRGHQDEGASEPDLTGQLGRCLKGWPRPRCPGSLAPLSARGTSYYGDTILTSTSTCRRVRSPRMALRRASHVWTHSFPDDSESGGGRICHTCRGDVIRPECCR